MRSVSEKVTVTSGSLNFFFLLSLATWALAQVTGIWLQNSVKCHERL